MEDFIDLYLPESDLASIIQKKVRDLNYKQRILTLCERFPQAFELGNYRGLRGSNWKEYPFDNQISFYIDVSHPEALTFFRETLQEEKEAVMSQALSIQEEVGIKKMLAANIKAIKSVLPKIMTVERMMRISYTAITRNPQIARCTPLSILNAVIEAAMLGLEVNSPLEQASIVPFYNSKTQKMEAQLIVEFKGKIELAYRSGMVKVFQYHPVFEKDKFHYEYGLDPTLTHIPSKDADRGKLVAAYAVTNYLNGGRDFEVIEEAEAMQAKAKSASAKQDEKNKTSYSLWNTDDEPAMWCKTAVHRIFKRVPKSPEFRELARAQELSAKAEAGEPQDLDYFDAEFTSVGEPTPITNGNKESEQEKEKTKTKEKKQKAEKAVEREEPGNPIWAQLDATREAVPEIFLKAGLDLKLDSTKPITKLEDAKKIMAECNRIADGGK